MKFEKKNISKKVLLELFQGLLKSRLIEEKMLILLRQGKITKWFSGIGQEAVSIGAAVAMGSEGYILPMHRNLGVFTSRGVPMERLFAQFQGKASGFTKGRDRSFHFGTNEHKIVGMISHLGPQLSLADGIALAEKLDGTENVTLVFTGEGGASEGEFHEALNVAAVWDLPVIFLVENNGYGLSTPTSEQYKVSSFTEKGDGYGIEAVKIDGNNVLEVFNTLNKLKKSIKKKPRPVLVEAVTFRMRGHEEASGTKYVPEELFDLWAKKDPIENFQQFLLKEKVIGQEEIDQFVENFQEEVSTAWETANQEPIPAAVLEEELNDVYAPVIPEKVAPESILKSEKRFVDAISDGLKLAMKKYPELVLMGQDIAEYGGVFKVTEGLLERFGKERVRNTPICESAIVGVGLGLSIRNKKAMVEMQFADFVSCGFNQIVNNLAKSFYRWGQNADVVVRLPTGAGVGAGPFHSQSNEAWFFTTPGLKVLYPSTPADAKGLLLAAFEDPNPVLFFEHKKLYRSISEEIHDDYYTVPIGEGIVRKEGEDLTIVTYGMGVHWAKEVSEDLVDVDVEIIDLRTILPWDKEIVQQSVKKTGRVLVLTEDSLTGSVASEIAAWVGEYCFEFLDAPVKRVGSLDTPIPFGKNLENEYLASARLLKAVVELAEF